MNKNIALLAVVGLGVASLTASASERSLKHHHHLEAAYHSIERAQEHYNHERKHEAQEELNSATRELDAAENHGGFGGHRENAKEDVRRAKEEIERHASPFEVEKLLRHAKEETDKASEYADEHRG